MVKYFIAAFTLSLLFSAAASQPTEFAPTYHWNQVTGMTLYDLGEQTPYCNAEEIRDTWSSGTKIAVPNWDELRLILAVEPELNWDIGGTSQCLVLLIDFKDEAIPFLVFPQQGALFDLRAHVFCYHETALVKEFEKAVTKLLPD